MTVFSAESFNREVDAVNEDDARRFAEQFADREYPDAHEIRVDEIELLTAEPAPQPDPLALARDIIAGLLDAAHCGVAELERLSHDCAPGMAAAYRVQAKDAWESAKAAEAFLAQEPGA
jgi:hypothetical protein